MVDTKTVTLSQFELMKHAIGIERDRIKRSKYVAYRNYFLCMSKDAEWESLVEQGLAISRKSFNNNSIFYCVTTEGIRIIERILEIKVVGY
jgi:predicted transcriptional regulator